STDGGATFTRGPGPTTTTTTGNADPVVVSGSEPGELYYASISFRDDRSYAIAVARSVDDGKTFAPFAFASPAVPRGRLQDKPWIAVDRDAGSPDRGNVYVAWIDLQRDRNVLRFARSRDHGSTFEPQVAVPGTEGPGLGYYGYGPIVEVLPGGDVVVAWMKHPYDGYGERLPGTSGSILVARSSDGGRTFGPPVTAASYEMVPSTDGIGLIPGGPRGIRTLPFLSLSVDGRGFVHIVYHARPAPGSVDPSDVFAIRSTDGGRSFSLPVRLNDDLTATAQFVPSVAAARDGTLAAKWWDRRAHPGDRLVDVFMAISRDAGATWEKSFRVTDHSWFFRPRYPEPANLSVYFGDYDGLTADADRFWLSWSDERSVEPDVFVTSVPTSREARVADFHVAAREPFLRVEAGRDVEVPVDVVAENGFTGMVALEVAGVPTGVSARLEPRDVAAGQSSMLRLSTASDAPARAAMLTISAGAGSRVRRTNVDLVVTGGRGANNPPSATILNPRPGTTAGPAGQTIQFSSQISDADAGDVLQISWDFGDGSSNSDTAFSSHSYAVAGSYRATLSVRDLSGATTTASVDLTISDAAPTGVSRIVPVVIEAPGASGSRFQTEVTLVSRFEIPGTSGAQTPVYLRYTSSLGSGSGTASRSVGTLSQASLPDFVEFLRGRGVPIPRDGTGQAGTLAVTFGGIADDTLAFAGARVFTKEPSGGDGTFGLFFPSIDTSTTTATVYGLQQDASTRSNLAVLNAGASPITLRIRLYGPSGEDLGALSDLELPTRGWNQISQPLLGKATSGYATITRVAGASPFSAYGVLNDAVTSDGSFLAPLLPGDSSPAERFVPVVLDVSGVGGARFRTELTLANLSSTPLPLRMRYQPASGFGGGAGEVLLTLAAREQRVLADVIAFLRRSLPIEADGRNVAGTLMVSAPEGTSADAFAVGARTFVPREGGGTYGLFYAGSTSAESATSSAWVYALRQDARTRSNLAVANRGDAGPITLRATWYSSIGTVLGSVEKTLEPGEWYQFGQPLAAFGALDGFAHVERISGASRFVAYGVLNDNVTSDGSFVPMASFRPPQ
ncbi:MAG: PKD domain-containing protein, partial [Acidobacteria bacterium]|nr:PKD domain-containing protein [Acidobacteriota bacterium]